MPPPAPEDDPSTAHVIETDEERLGRLKRGWPGWVTSANGYPIGSRWRLERPAVLVAPRRLGYVTLALTAEEESAGRYGLQAGTILTLVETYDPDDDPWAQDLALANFYQYADGWSSRTYRIEDGPSAGTLVRMSSDPMGRR